MSKAGRIILIIIAILVGFSLPWFRDGNIVIQYYDRWSGLIPFLFGIYIFLIAKGVLPRKPKDPEKLNEWRKKYGTFMTIAGPFMVLFGGFLLATEVTKPVRETAKPTMYRIQAGVPESDGWYIAESTAGHFKVKLPGPFNDFSVVGTNQEGKKTETSTVGLQSQEKVKFSASRIKIEGGIRDKRKYAENFFQKFNDKILGVRELSFRNLTATEARMQNAGGGAVMRIIPTDSGVYLLIVEYPLSFEKRATDLIPGFMDSLELAPN